MLREIGSKNTVTEFVKNLRPVRGCSWVLVTGCIKTKSWAKNIKQVADRVFEGTGRNPLLDALEVEEDCPGGSLFYQAEALPECRFLFRHYLRGDGISGGDVSHTFCHPRTSGWIAHGGDAFRSRAKDSTATADLFGTEKRVYEAMEQRRSESKIFVKKAAIIPASRGKRMLATIRMVKSLNPKIENS